MSEVIPCDISYKCIEYDKKGTKQCEQCENSKLKKSFFKPKKQY